MKTLYFDCTNGVSGDMVLQALVGLTDDPQVVINFIRRIERDVKNYGKEHDDLDHKHDDGNEGHPHRSYSEVKDIIKSLDLSSDALDMALNVYSVIAQAESKVHGDSLEDLHFHEVSRDQAIANVAGVSFCMDLIKPDGLLVSTVCDGHGTVECAHGILDVPVPAVKAMLDTHEIAYEQTEKVGERVTPSGLAMLIGLGFSTGNRPSGTPVRVQSAMGRRSLGDKGLVAELFEK